MKYMVSTNKSQNGLQRPIHNNEQYKLLKDWLLFRHTSRYTEYYTDEQVLLVRDMDPAEKRYQQAELEAYRMEYKRRQLMCYRAGILKNEHEHGCWEIWDDNDDSDDLLDLVHTTRQLQHDKQIIADKKKQDIMQQAKIVSRMTDAQLRDKQRQDQQRDHDFNMAAIKASGIEPTNKLQAFMNSL